MNVVVLKGNLVRDPVVKSVNNTHVTNFTLAVNRYFKKSDGSRDKETTYVDCEAWDTGAVNLGDKCAKGDPLLIRGALKLDQWETDGQKRSRLKVRVASFELLYRAPATPESDREQEAEGVAADDVDGDDIPF